MNIKLALGIILPLALILSLVILSTANIGFSVEKKDAEYVRFSPLFVDKNSPTNNIPIETITITNDFFLPKRYELPRLQVCLNDKEGVKEIQNMQVRYNEGFYTRGSDVPIFDELIFGYDYHSRQSIELPAESKKQIKILVEPEYLYSYDTDIESYKAYDELLLIESQDTDRYSYNSCQNLDSKEIESAIHIPIIK